MKTLEYWQWENGYAKDLYRYCKPGVLLSLAAYEAGLLLANAANVINSPDVIRFVDKNIESFLTADFTTFILSGLGLVAAGAYGRYTKKRLENFVGVSK